MHRRIKNHYPFFLAFLIIAGCSSGPKKTFPTIPGYDLNNPITVKLKSELAEISGLAYYAKDTSVFANIDEEGILYKIYLRQQPKILRWRYSKKNDYEDLCLVDSTFFVLQSNGDIYWFRILSEDSIVVEQAEFPIDGKNEFEALYYNESEKKLVLICKDCEIDDKKSTSAWAFDPATKSFSSAPYFVLDGNEISDELAVKREKFKPSAAAIHPITKELYIVASVNKALIITDVKGNIKEVVPLDPSIFKQPEGMTFSPSGDLYISNESAENGQSNIQVFKYKSKS